MYWSKRQWFQLGFLLGVIVAGSSCSLLAPSDRDLFGRAGNAGRIDPASGAGGEGGTDGGAGAGGAGGESGMGAASGTGASPAGGAPGVGCDELVCDVNADCLESSGEARCACRSGFTGDGVVCRRFVSCDELHEAEPALPSGAYPVRPMALTSDIETYCEMSAEGGGWTLTLNEGNLTFDARTEGIADQLCFATSCTNLAYSTVLLGRDIMLDLSDELPIEGENFAARVVFTAVDPRAYEKTVRQLFSTGPYYLDDDDNSNVLVLPSGEAACSEALPYELATILCDPCPADGGCGDAVLVFGDSDSACAPGITFAIGAAYSHTTPWGQCAGWPQEPNLNAFNYLPDYYRVWIR